MTKRHPKKGRKGSAHSVLLQPASTEEKGQVCLRTAALLPPEKLVRYFPWLLLAVIGIVYGHALFFQFVDWDDNLNVYENPYLLSLSLDGLRRLWSGPYASLYVPLVYTTYFFELWLADSILYVPRLWNSMPTEQATGSFFRIASSIMHFDNLLLHWASSLCVFFLLRRVFNNGGWGIIIATLVFALHPIQVEPVVWVTGRKDLLMWTLALGALVSFLRASDKNRIDLRLVSVSTFLFVASLFSKPTAVIVPLLAAVLTWFFRRGERRVGMVIAIWFGVAALAFVVHRAPQSDLTDAPFLLPWWKRPFLAADNLWFYFQKLIAPWPLLPIYPRKVSDVFGSEMVWVKLPLTIGTVLILMRHRIGVLGTLFVLVPVLPVLGFVPFIYQYFSVIADRYFYGSMVGVSILTCAGIERGLRSAWGNSPAFARLISAGLLTWLVGIAITSGVQARHWKDSVSLWQHELRHYPSCVHALYNLASRHAEQGRLKEAIELYERILVVDPYYAAAYTNLIILNEQLGRKNEMRLYAQAALELPPNCAENFLARGHGYLALGQPAEAVESFKAAIHGLPEDAPAHNSLGMAYVALGDLPNAEKAFRCAIALNPALLPAHLNLADLLVKRGDLSGAMAEYEEVLRIDPNHERARRRLEELRKSTH